MIPLSVPNLNGNENRYLKECISSNFVSSVGPFVERFEKAVAVASGARVAVATCSGTSALHVALTAVGVRRDDLVVVPSFSFIASANAIAMCAASPWLLDIDSESWTIDVELLEKIMAKETSTSNEGTIHVGTGKRIGAILPVYTLGTPAKMDDINEIARKYNLPVVADAACAIGSKYNDQDIGHLADLTTFSFNGNKTITTGGGGAVVGNDSELLEHVRHLSTTAKKGPGYHHDQVGFNYRMTNVAAAIGCAQLETLSEFVAAKRRISQTYQSQLESERDLEIFPVPKWAQSACWFSGVLVAPNCHLSVSRLTKELRETGIQSNGFWKPIHLQPPYKRCLKSVQQCCERIWSRILVLPCSTSLETVEQQFVIDKLKSILKRNSVG